MVRIVIDAVGTSTDVWPDTHTHSPHTHTHIHTVVFLHDQHESYDHGPLTPGCTRRVCTHPHTDDPTCAYTHTRATPANRTHACLTTLGGRMAVYMSRKRACAPPNPFTTPTSIFTRAATRASVAFDAHAIGFLSFVRRHDSVYDVRLSFL